ncbi:serine/threonine-protein kinase [Leptothoe spongobia]|uniref:Serine/threonine protein kinase n=1 Tax=Leptothoe spongobia TAU-MAC 1115 TaxID=1967444 RepID=A0A947DFU2_9CYAN|nr:serine/threonine-protein kinase [Leptothoe spongobia]MBT9316130.1 serine/threonine protein kinase [Leptothoe spongobia TAU-MAC 1115]
MNISHQRSNYRLLGLVGNGQFGRVYCGIHRKTGQLVAIKYLHRHSLPTHAFLRELRCLLSLVHPNIVVCHALENCDQGRRLVLEYCAGGTLRSHMLSTLQLTDIFNLISDVLGGLAHAHQQGVVHCDIKPENILLSHHNGRWRAKISDFGIAKLVQEQPYRQGTGQTGSPAYMAPERFYRQYSPAADVYAVGVILFELLVGQRPFSGTPTVLESAHLNQPVPAAEQLIEPLKAIITKALEKLPARRYPSATEMLADFQTIDLPSLDLALPNRSLHINYCAYTGQPFHQLTKPVEHLKEWSLQSVEQTSTEQPETTHRMLMAHGAQLAILEKQALSCSPQVLDGPVQGLYPSQTGLIVSTEHSLWSGPCPELLTPLLHWPTSTMVDIAPHHRWAATVTPQVKRLNILQLHSSGQTGWSVKRPLSPDLNIRQILAIDSGHLVIVGHSEKTGTQLQLWNRRGMYLNSLDLGIHLRQLTPMRQPHHWMAIDSHAPKTVILLTLKPLRINRITIDIHPTLMIDLPWGYLFSDTEGRILLLDRDFHPIGGIQGPKNITAITPSSSHELIVATWQDQTHTGELHCLDLYTFDLDMIF